MLVYPVGTKVTMGPVDDAVEGVVTGIWIRENEVVDYQVAWMNGRAHCCEWINRQLLRFLPDGPTRRIGFEGPCQKTPLLETRR